MTIPTKDKNENDLKILLGENNLQENEAQTPHAIALAKQNSYAFRIVTQKGDIINPSGAITGGSVVSKTVNILGRKQEIETLENTVKKQDMQLERITKEKEEYITSIEDVLEQAMALESALQEAEIKYATKKQKLVSIEENIIKLESKLEKSKEEKGKLEQERIENDRSIEALEQEITIIEQENEELNRIISDFANKNKEIKKEVDELNFDITNLKISVNSFNESEESINEIVERVENEIKANKASITTKEQQIQKCKEENQELAKRVEKRKQEIESTKQKIKDNNETIEKIKKERTEKSQRLEEIENNIIEQFKLLEDLKEQINKIEIKKSKFEIEIEQIVNKMWEEYEITPNNVAEYERPENPQEVQKHVISLRNQIKELGSINIDSIEEYKQTKERYDFMTEQKEDLESTITKLKKIINDMMQIMKEQFAKQFKIINKNFGEIFTELFGGGKAELKLADETNILECGIDIEVQPPGKKLQNMMLLSGGEKALTAIALLFAILKINPAPFCVLDEIEAALDDVNVYRFAEYLKKFTKEIQFLVITHRKGTMEAADTVYGITMEENGVSKLLSMKLK